MVAPSSGGAPAATRRTGLPQVWPSMQKKVLGLKLAWAVGHAAVIGRDRGPWCNRVNAGYSRGDERDHGDDRRLGRAQGGPPDAQPESALPYELINQPTAGPASAAAVRPRQQLHSAATSPGSVWMSRPWRATSRSTSGSPRSPARWHGAWTRRPCMSRFSRLLVDPNRPLDDPTLIPQISDGVGDPGQQEPRPGRAGLGAWIALLPSLSRAITRLLDAGPSGRPPGASGGVHAQLHTGYERQGAALAHRRAVERGRAPAGAADRPAARRRLGGRRQ